MTRKSVLGTLGLALMLAGAGFAGVACEDDGPVENAGEAVDEAVDDAGDAIEDAAD